MNQTAVLWVQLSVLFFIALATRVPFASKFLYELDSIQYALALENYDVYLHQPQPPGYFIYVMAGKAVNFFLQDPNLTFVGISVLTSALTVAAIFYLGTTIFGREVGLWAGLTAITSPLFWFYGEVALNFVVAAFFNTWTALLCWKVLQKEHKWLYLCPVVLGIAAGIRPDLLIFLFPLWLFCLIRTLPWQKVLILLVVLGITILFWFIPMLFAAGGPARYFVALKEHWDFHNTQLTIWNAGVSSRKDVLLTTVGYMSYGLGLGTVFLLFSLYALIRTASWHVLTNEKSIFFGLWLLPALLFHAFLVLHPYLHRYGIFFLPGLSILLPISVAFAASEINRFTRLACLSSRRSRSLLLAILLAVNCAIFVTSENAYSAKRIQQHDRNLAIVLSGLKANFPSECTVVVDGKSHFFYSYRHIQYYLPEYRAYLADLRVNKRGEKWDVFGAANGRTFRSDTINIPLSTKYIVYLMDPSDDEYRKQLENLNLDRVQLENDIHLYYRRF